MLSILDHAWGKSSAQDLVWAEVCGLPPLKAARRVLVMLQAYIDDSIDDGKGIWVLAGYIADASEWAQFSKEWEELLQLLPPTRSGVRRFKMSEVAASEELMNYLPAFYAVIEKYVMASVSCKISSHDLKRIQSRLFVPDVQVDWEKFTSPYFVTFRCLMDMFHSRRAELAEWIPDDEKIDFFFDYHSDSGAVAAMWDNYMRERPEETRKYYGGQPSFRNDESLLPLQAADFWAWWVRKWYRDNAPEKLAKRQFEVFERPRKRKFLQIDITFDQDQLAEVMTRALRSQLDPSKPIIDLRGLNSFQGVDPSGS